MSSLRNAAKSTQKIHRERHQPESRQHLGFLEKKKDYKRRAKYFEHKKRTIQNAAKKALERNPDEFYFHMINSRLEDGEHHENEEKDKHTPEQVLMMQSQDLKYITMKLTSERKKIERLKAQLQLIGIEEPLNKKKIERLKAQLQLIGIEEPLNKKVIFDELGRRMEVTNRTESVTEDLAAGAHGVDLEDEFAVERLAKQSSKGYAELEKRLDRARELSVIRRKLELKMMIAKTKSGEEKPQRIEPATVSAPPVYKWKNIRKR
ncbi:unnamed protein product [Notodromas monacha]|uniref:U3 small nucleolar RNA-associated protein 11 n=1 Tax=Notodromas monacha TaxID=399045 RepID=A0A7R9BTS3_9CRUS|nr:unnamed protein product [Notodromas monacha]CAG0920541.1 unnamed protein product [Notodromas monacha]